MVAQSGFGFKWFSSFLQPRLSVLDQWQLLFIPAAQPGVVQAQIMEPACRDEGRAWLPSLTENPAGIHAVVRFQHAGASSDWSRCAGWFVGSWPRS
jgi:hypothetical protein